MIDVTLTCYHCKSENIVRNGITRNGKQRYKCYDCERTSRDLPQPAGYSTDEQEEYCELMKNAVLYVAWSGFLVSRVRL